MMNRRRRRNKKHDYSVLEPRQLLATTGLSQFDGDASIDTGLIVNGSFDSNDIPDQTSQRVAITDVPGWNQTTGASETVSLVGFDDSPRGTGFHLDDQAGILESIYQDVDTESGQLYTLAFDLLGRPVDDTAADDSNDVRVLWDGVEVGTFRGITDFWQTFTVDVTGGTDDLTRLELEEVAGSGNDGIGAMLDNLRLVPVTNQTLENGSFEDNESGTIEQDNVPGWSVIADEGQRDLDVQNGGGSDGSRFVNLDLRTDNSDILFTSVPTEAGGVYFVSFDLRSESGIVGEDEEVRIRWNDTWVGTYRGTDDWQGHGFTVRAESDSTRLVFREPGNAFTGDGDGPQLDNVRITRVVPTISVSLNDTSAFEFTENGSAIDLGARIDSINSTVSDAVSSITVSLPAGADASEVLRVQSDGSTLSSNNGVLTIDGNRTAAQFLSVLQTLEYANTSDNPTTGSRPVSIQVNEANTSSPAATLTVNVTAENDAPEVNAIADTTAVVGDVFTLQAVGTDAENDALSWTVSASGTAVENGDPQPTIDANGNISFSPQRAGEATLTVRATDEDTLFDEQSFTVTVTATETIIDVGPVLVNSGSDLPLFDSSAATDPAIGQTIANFEARTITDGTFNSIEPGVARIYSVLAHWCPFCQQELPEIVEWLEDTDLGSDVEFVAAAVSIDPSRDNYPPAEWFERENFDETIIVDNPAARLMDIFGTQSFPFLVAVDANGEVVDRFSGISTRAQLDAALAAIRGS